MCYGKARGPRCLKRPIIVSSGLALQRHNITAPRSSSPRSRERTEPLRIALMLTVVEIDPRSVSSCPPALAQRVERRISQCEVGGTNTYRETIQWTRVPAPSLLLDSRPQSRREGLPGPLLDAADARQLGATPVWCWQRGKTTAATPSRRDCLAQVAATTTLAPATTAAATTADPTARRKAQRPDAVRPEGDAGRVEGRN
jgi:hypothetical protein